MRNSQEIQSQNEKNRQIQQRQFIEVENISQDDQKIQQPVTKDNPKNQSFQVQQNDSRQSKQTFQKNIFNEDKLSNDKSKNIQQNNQNYQDGQQKQSSQRQNFQDSQVLNKPQIQINTEKLQNEIDAKNMTAEKIYNHSSSDLNVSFENQEKIVPNKNQVQNISNQTRNLQKVKQMNMDYHNNSQNSKQDQVKQFIGQPQVNEYKNLVPVAKRNSKQNIKIKPMTMKNQGVDDYQINENSSQNQIENPKKFERRIQNTNSRQSNHSEDPKYILIQSKNQNYNQDRDIKDKSQKNVKFHDQSEQALEYKKQQGNYMQENTKKIQINHQSKQNELVNDQSIINDEDYDFDSQQKQPKNILIKIDTQSNFEREKLSKKQDHNIIQNNFMRKSHDKSINEIDQQSSPFKKQIKPDQRELIDKKVYLKQHDDIDPEPESENEYDQNLNIVQSQYNDKNRQFQLQHRNSRFTFTQNNNIENQSHQKIYSQNDNVDKLIRQLDKESPLNLQQSNDSYQYQSKQKNKDSQEILCHIQKSHNKYDQANNQDCDLQSLMEESNVKQSNQHQKFEHISKNKQIQSHTLEKSQKIANQIRQNSNQVIKTNNQVNNSFIDEIERKKQLFNQQMKQFDKGQIQKQSLVNDSTNRVQNIQRLNQQSQQKLVKDSQSSRKIQDFNSFYQESQDGEQNIQKQQVQRNLIFQSQNIQDSQISLIDEKQEQINKIQGIHGNDNDQKEKMITQQIVKHDISINQFSMESNKQSKLNSPLKQNEKQDQVSGEKTIKSEIKIKFIQKVIFLYEMNDELVKEKSDLLMKIDMLNRSLYEKDQENIRLQNSHSQLENTVSNLNKSLTISQRRSNSPKIFQQKSFTRNYSSSKEQKTIFKSRNNSSYFDNSTDMNQSNSKFTNLPFKRLIPSKLTKNTIVIEYNIEVFKQLTIKMGNTNLTRFKLSCIQDKCSLFKNEQIKVGIIKDYNHHNDNVFVRMDLYFENLTYDPISNLYCEFAHDDDGKIFISEILIWEQSSILIKNLMGKTQKKEEIIISLLKSPFQLIHLHGNFQCNDNPVIFNTILPCTLLNYMIYSTIKKDIFKQQFSNSFVFTTNRFKLNRNLIKINQDFLAIFPLSVDILKNGKQAKYQFCQGTQFIINQSQQYYLKLKVYMDDSVKISIGCPDQDTKNQTIKSILQTLMFILKK